MSLKKFLPVLLLIVMAVLTLVIRRGDNTYEPSVSSAKNRPVNSTARTNHRPNFNRSTAKLFFTKHAKCRMKCRHITQKEVYDILRKGSINYSKSNLNDTKAAVYALEGITKDRQRVRIIFAPKKQHIAVVTVIDLDREYACNCN